jgi:hypothetical protein
MIRTSGDEDTSISAHDPNVVLKYYARVVVSGKVQGENAKAQL